MISVFYVMSMMFLIVVNARDSLESVKFVIYVMSMIALTL